MRAFRAVQVELRLKDLKVFWFFFSKKNRLLAASYLAAFVIAPLDRRSKYAIVRPNP